MRHYFKFILMITGLQAFALNYDYIKSNEAKDLPKLGEHSCFIIQKQETNPTRDTKVCSATILSNHQLVYDRKCLYRRNPRDTRTNELHCQNKSIKVVLPIQTNYSKGIGVLNLSAPLPIVSPKLERLKQYTDDNFKNCYIKSANKYINIKPLDSNTKITKNGIIQNSILNSTDIGSGLFCKDSEGEEIILGALDQDLKIQTISEIEDQNKLTNLQKKLALNNENINSKCREAQFCLDSFSIQVTTLTKDTLDILNELNEKLKNSAQLEENISELELNFEEIRLECNKMTIAQRQSADDQVQTGFLSGTMGLIEDYGISAINFFNSDFLVNQFKDVEIIGENLSGKEIESIFNDIKDKNPNLNNIELIKKVATSFTDKIIQEVTSTMDIERLSPDKFKQFKETTRKDLDKCLKKADSKNKILECSDKFALTASVKISEIELENQLEENFKELFKNPEDYLNLTTSTKDTFYRCINKFFYTQKSTDNSSAAKGCVLQSVITAFNKTKDQTVREYMIDAGTKNEEIIKLTKEINDTTKSCNNYDIIYSVNSNSVNDLERLSAIDPDDFKDYLFDCIEKFSLAAGRIITQESVKNHPQISQIINDPKEINLITQNTALRLYDNCINSQKVGKNANKCRDLITAGTTLEVAKKEMAKTIIDLSGGNQSLRDSLLIKVNESINKCQSSLEKKHFDAVKASMTGPSEKATTECLKEAVLLIVKDVTKETIDKTIKKEEIVKPYLTEILNNSEIKGISEKVTSCFSKKLSDANTIEAFTGAIDKTKEVCQFSAEKEAIGIIAPIVLSHKLYEALESKEESQKIAKEYTNGQAGLIARLNNASTKEELTSITNQITPDLTVRGANFLIPKLVQEMLEGFPNEIKNKITKDLLTSIKSCILTIDKNSQDQTREIDKCINLSTKKGYEEISARIIFKNIDAVLGTDKSISQELFKISKNRFSKCANQINHDQSSAEYKQTINKCMIEEVGSLSFEIPREAILLYAPASGLDINRDDMREKLLDIESFYSGKSNNNPKSTGQSILDSHIVHMECISSAKKELQRVNETDMSKVQKAYSKCTDNVEKNIKLGIAEIFAKKHSTDRKSYSPMYNLGKTLIQLTSNEPDDAKSPQGTQVLDLISPERKPLSETFSQMHLVGEKFKMACDLSPRECSSVAQRTLNDITAYKTQNPKASGDDLFNKFIDSNVMDFVVNSEISSSLSTQLKEGMKDYLDSESLLLNSINDITSPSEIQKLMNTQEGKLAKEAILAAIKNNTIDNIMDDKKFRELFAKVLTTQTQNDSFIDKLIFGLIQPRVKEEKRTSNGLFGIFKNPTVSLGRLLGIVNGSNFDWNKIRNTKDGSMARQIFAKEVFAPIVKGIDLEKEPANNKKYKNRIEELTAQIEDLIVKGVKSL